MFARLVPVSLVGCVSLALVVGLLLGSPNAPSASEDNPFAEPTARQPGDNPFAEPAAPPAKAGQPTCLPAERIRKQRAAPKPQRRGGEAAIEQALLERTSMEFIDTPLSDVIDFLKDRHGIEIQIDKRALDDAGIGADTPMTKNLKGISLRSALRLMLRDLGLAYMIKDEVLLITTPERAESDLQTKVYDVGDLVTCRDQHGELWEDYDTLVDAVVAAASSSTWEANGGPGAIKGATFGTAKVLVVRQTQEVHQQVVDLLAELRKHMRRDGGKAEPPKRHRPAPAQTNVPSVLPPGRPLAGPPVG